jgi:hypothetical protein
VSLGYTVLVSQRPALYPAPWKTCLHPVGTITITSKETVSRFGATTHKVTQGGNLMSTRSKRLRQVTWARFKTNTRAWLGELCVTKQRSSPRRHTWKIYSQLATTSETFAQNAPGSCENFQQLYSTSPQLGLLGSRFPVFMNPHQWVRIRSGCFGASLLCWDTCLTGIPWQVLVCRDCERSTWLRSRISNFYLMRIQPWIRFLCTWLIVRNMFTLDYKSTPTTIECNWSHCVPLQSVKAVLEWEIYE